MGIPHNNSRWSDDPDLQRIAEYVLWMRRRQGLKVKPWDFERPKQRGSIGEGRGEFEDLLYGPLLNTPVGLGDWEQVRRDRRLVDGLLVQIAWDIRERELRLRRKVRIPLWNEQLVQDVLRSRDLTVSL
jgi:hypothetical protein